MSQEKSEQSDESRKPETTVRGRFAIPKGELDDMKKEYNRVARKHPGRKPAPPKK